MKKVFRAGAAASALLLLMPSALARNVQRIDGQKSVAYDCGPMAGDGDERAFARGPLLSALAAVVDGHSTEPEIERALKTAAEADVTTLDLDTRLLAQNMLFRIATAYGTRWVWYGDEKTTAIGVSAAKQVMRFALPADVFTAIGHEPDPAIQAWLGPKLAWTERVTTFCGSGELLVHDRVFNGALAFRPIRSGETRGLVAQVVAFDDTGAAHVTPIVERVEMRRGLAVDSPVCVAHLDLEAGGSPAVIESVEQLHPDNFVFRAGDGVGCASCHSTTDSFAVADVPDPVEARGLLDARRERVEAHAGARLQFFLPKQ